MTLVKFRCYAIIEIIVKDVSVNGSDGDLLCVCRHCELLNTEDKNFVMI